MPYLDRDRQLAYQNDWMRRRRAAWIATVGGACVICGSTEKLEFCSTTGRSHKGIWSRKEAAVRELLQGAKLLCRTHAAEHHRARLSQPRVLERAHGTTTKYKQERCRCEPCREAYRTRRRTWVRHVNATEPSPAASELYASSCAWCGCAGDGMVKGRGASSGQVLHRECYDAVALFLGWDEPIPPAI